MFYIHLNLGTEYNVLLYIAKRPYIQNATENWLISPKFIHIWWGSKEHIEHKSIFGVYVSTNYSLALLPHPSNHAHVHAHKHSLTHTKCACKHADPIAWAVIVHPQHSTAQTHTHAHGRVIHIWLLVEIEPNTPPKQIHDKNAEENFHGTAKLHTRTHLQMCIREMLTSVFWTITIIATLHRIHLYTLIHIHTCY